MRDTHTQLLRLLGVHYEKVVRVNAGEDGLAVIQVVAAPAKVKIQNVYGIDLFNLVVLLAYLYMFRNGL